MQWKGQPCPECGAKIQVVNSTPLKEFRRRYYGCRECGFRPENNVEYVPLFPKRGESAVIPPTVFRLFSKVIATGSNHTPSHDTDPAAESSATSGERSAERGC